MNRRFAATALGAGLLLTGCAAPGTAAPTASEASEPAVLTLAFTQGFADAPIGEFERSLAEAAGDSISLEISGDFDPDAFAPEQKIVDAVASGDIDLGWVGARAFSELGVHDFDALIAPLLIDSLATERAVLAGDIPTRMLAGLDGIGVHGLAVMGGPLRRPIAADRPLLTVADFQGTPFYAVHGDVNTATLAALGADGIDATSPARNDGIAAGTIRGYENTVVFFSSHPDWRTDIMTANLNLWPAVGILIANPDSLARLSAPQRAALEEAASGTASRALDVLDPEEATVSGICAGGGRFAQTTPDALGGLRAQVEPVYAGLRENAATSAFLDEIVAIKGSTPPDGIEIPQGCSAS